MNKNCIICRKEYTPHSRGKKGVLSKFCSNKCKFIYQKDNPAKKRTGIYKKCLFCGKEFYVQKNQNDYQYCSNTCGNFSRRGKSNPKLSKTLSQMISTGKLNPKRNYYKQGYFKSKITGIKEYYGSSYELKRMKQLDMMGVNWTKKHGITIKYIDKGGKLRYYVPDFLVEDKIMEEVKPSILVNSKIDNNIFKKLSAEKYCRDNKYEYRIITEKELEI